MSTPAVEQIYRRMLSAAGAQGRFVPCPSGRLVHVVTTGDGPPVVHLHGSNTSSLSHLMLAERSPGLRSYLVDRPGFGLSDPAPFRPGNYREYAVGVVNDVLGGLDLDRPVLVGASAGGSWALWYALAHPERVRALVLLSAPPTLPGARPPLPYQLAASPVLGDLISRVKPGRRMMLSMMASMGERETIEQHPELLGALLAGARDPVTSRANLCEVRALISGRGIRPEILLTREELHRLAVPTVMICGDRDPVLPLQHARTAVAEIPGARLELLRAGHVPQLGHPDQVAALLNDFALTP